MFKRVDKLLFDLGYCSKVGLRHFLNNNELTIIKQQPGSKKVIHEKFLGSKKQLRQVIGTNNLLINGQPVHTSDPLIIAFDKPVGWMTDGLGSLYDYQHFQYHQKIKKGISLGSETPIEILEEENEQADIEDEEDYDDSPQLDEVSQSYSIIDLLPKEYPLRKPGFDSILPLPDSVAGLTVVTQLYTLVKAFRSVRAPCKRVYRIQTRDRFTGLEDEALLHFRSDIKDSLKKIINPPEFKVIDERNNIAEITIYDYKPDKIQEMMSSIRHQLVDIKRIGLGGLTLDDLPNLEQPKLNEEGLVENKEKTWVRLDNELLEKLMSSKNEVVGRLRVEKDNAQRRREDDLRKFASSSNISSLEFSKQEEQEEFEKETVITEEILGVDEDYDIKPPKRQERMEGKSVNINQFSNNMEGVDIELDEADMEELQRWGDEEEAAFEAEKRKKEAAATTSKKPNKQKKNKRNN